jgi:branched-chain amino acid transport system ATP-binding protein
MLSLEEINVHYGEVQILHSIVMHVGEREIVSLVGSNSTGKTTLLNTIAGLINATLGKIFYEGKQIQTLAPQKIMKLGISLIPEGRRLFTEMSVIENLEVGSYSKGIRGLKEKSLEEVFSYFPVLAQRKGQRAASLSGGEQQMLAIARALMARPRLLMLDEPSLGLAPLLVTNIFEIIRGVNQQGTAILLAEQNVVRSLRLSNRGYVLENGRIGMEGLGKELLENPYLKKAYLGMI